jgi:hypothetical protein
MWRLDHDRPGLGAAQGSDFLAQGVNLLALHLHQFAQRVEVLALDQVHIGDKPLCLSTHHRFHFPPDAVSHTGGFVHHATQIVKNSVALAHWDTRSVRRQLARLP